MSTDSAVTPLLPPPAGASTGGSALGVYIAVALTALSPVSFGYVLGFSSPAAAPLLASGLLTPRQLDIFEALSPLGGIAGAAVAGIGADYFGRTRALALSCAPFALGWALISAAEVRSAGATTLPGADPNQTPRLPLAQGAGALFVGRLLTGAGVGCGLNIVPVYVAEIAPSTCVFAPASNTLRPLPCVLAPC